MLKINEGSDHSVGYSTYRLSQLCKKSCSETNAGISLQWKNRENIWKVRQFETFVNLWNKKFLNFRFYACLVNTPKIQPELKQCESSARQELANSVKCDASDVLNGCVFSLIHKNCNPTVNEWAEYYTHLIENIPQKFIGACRN